jgi:DNA polymerase-1
LDCCVTFEVYEVLKEQLDEVTSKVYAQSVALQGPILEMDLRGVLVDITARDDMLKELGKDINFLEEALKEILEDGIGTAIKPSSPKQLAELLYDVLGLPEQRNIKTGTRSVDRKALDKLKSYFYAAPIINHILAIRDLSKQASTLRTSLDGDNRIRTSFSIAGTDTGRFASYESANGTGSNLQNISPRLRHIFIADFGNTMVPK